MDEWRIVSSIEAGNGASVRIQIQQPDGVVLSKELEFEFSRVIYKLYHAMQDDILKHDPKEIEAARNEAANFAQLFDEPIYMEETPSEYQSIDRYARPWFIVTTRRGRIKVGWRKRVIVIDWSESNNRDTANAMFPNEDTTKDGCMIHAWSYAKARTYIDRITMMV